jgi:hypothetical protein
MQFFSRAMALFTLLAIGLTGCGGSSSGGDVTPNTVVVSRSTAGTVTAVANGGSRTLTLGFNASDARPIGNLQVAGLAALPAGWSGAPSFSCASVGSGNGCLLNLTYAPAAIAGGTFTLTYTYTSIAGNSASGSIEIAFAATVANNVVASAAPAGQIAGIVNSSRSVTVTFATDDGNSASGLLVTSNLAALPAGWSGNGGSAFGCTSIAAGNGCQLNLAYAPTAIGGGTLALDYSYLDNSGVAKAGTVNIPYTATSDNNIVAIPLTATQLEVRVGETAVAMLKFATDDGNVASAFTITSALPSGWSGPTGIACGGVITAGGCNASFTYAPASADIGTFTVTYSYADNSGVAKTGSFDIDYSAKTVYAYVASNAANLSYCPISGLDYSLGSCIATASGLNGPVGIAFHGDHAYVSDGVSIYACNVDSDGSLINCAPSGSGFQQPFTLASTTTHLYVLNGPTSDITRCGFNLDGSLANCVATTTGLLSTGGIAIANGTAYITDPGTGTVVTCTVDPTTGDFSPCGVTASGFNLPIGITVAGNYAYIAEQASDTVSVCAVDNNASLGSCSSYSVGGGPTSIAVFGNHAYVTSVNNNTVDLCVVDPATGALSSCNAEADPQFAFPMQLDIH